MSDDLRRWWRPTRSQKSQVLCGMTFIPIGQGSGLKGRDVSSEARLLVYIEAYSWKSVRLGTSMAEGQIELSVVIVSNL